MKVTIFSYEFPPNVYGGAGIHVKYLTKELAKTIDIEVRTLRAEGTKAFERREGIVVKRYSPLLKEQTPGGKVLEVISFDMRLVEEKIDADIVHTHTWYTNLAGFEAKRLYNVKLVATVHTLEPLRPWKKKQLGSGYKISCWMEETGLRACDRLIAVSKEMKRDITRCYGIPEERIDVVHNGIDAARYKKIVDLKLLKKFGIKKPYVLFVGRLTEQKGVFDLVKAAEKLEKGVNIVLLTGKPDTPSLTTRLKKAMQGKRNIIWLDMMLSEKELVPIYSGAEVFVCPSTYEPFGIINLEAMACEVPVVATAVGGIKEVVLDGETGFLTPPKNPRALAEAINRVLEDENMRRKMGKAGRKRVEEHFTWKRVAEKTIEVYEGVWSDS